MDQLRAALAVGQEAGRALVQPLYGTAELARRMRDAGVFGIVEILHPERAADIAGEDADLVGGHVEQARQDRLVAGDALGRHLQREAFGLLVVMRQRDARLHRDHGDAGVDDVELGHMRGGGERRLDPGGVAIMIVERDVIGDVVIELRRARLGRFGRIRHRGQRLDIDLDGFGRIASLRCGFRDHEGDGIADEAHLVGDERRAVGLLER
ncbi:hypothetical protein ACVWW1_003049 [Bradyrhizobium sp. JR3.5]